MEVVKERIVGELVAEDYRTATIFKAHNIDFCCRGNRSLQDVCDQNGINVDELINDLQIIASSKGTDGMDYKSLDLDLLIDFIVKKHHRYVENKIPELKAYLNKIAKVHGKRHPELYEIEKLFLESAHDLTSHMKKEEGILFPFIKSMVEDGVAIAPFGSVENPIEMMKHEHDAEGVRFRQIAELSDNYTPPADACTTYNVAFSMLQEFENDLHKHIHLENNILFPRAIQMQSQLN